MHLISLALLLACIGISRAADCLTNQQRQEDVPTGDQIARALMSESQVDLVCAGNWKLGDGDQLENSYNHWGLVYSIKRQDNTTPLRYCKDAIENIIAQCISGGQYWGGSWSLNGETYTISNSMYPGNPLAPTDDGGPVDDTGPITAAPAPTSGPEAFTTTTQNIDGLTTNSQTTTSVQGHETVLPIWFVGPDIGIIVIPGAGVPVGAPIPPPPSQGPLHINPEGQVEEGVDSRDDDDEDLSTSATTSSCAQCSDCPDLDSQYDDVPEDDSDYDLSPIDPDVWKSLDDSRAAATDTVPAPTVVPIDEPGCQDAADTVKDDLSKWTSKGRSIRLPDDTYPQVNDILYMLRQTVCDGSCKAPDKIDSKYVAVYQEGARCEVSVGISAEIEVYVNRDTWPEANKDFGTIWQQCWDSTQHIIDKCVDNQAKEGWWNGNHAYQYYSAGLRSLNDGHAHHTQKGIQISGFLMPSTEGVECHKHCCIFLDSYADNPEWCEANCNGACTSKVRRQDRKLRHGVSRSDFSRADEAPVSHLLKRESVGDVNGCRLQYTLPGYPSAGRAIAAGVPSIWFDVDSSQNCDNPSLLRANAAVSRGGYNTEHAYEKHMIRRYFYYLIGNEQDSDSGPIATCEILQRVFGTRASTGPFAAQTVAQQIANAVSCKGGGCPDPDRVSEFFLLKGSLNSMKSLILTGTWVGRGKNGNDNKLPRCGGNGMRLKDMQGQMIKAAMVYQYLNRQEVFDMFVVVHRRIQGILDQLDADPELGNGNDVPSGAFENSNWRATYDEFMVRFLTDTDRKMKLWLFECRTNYEAAVSNMAANDVAKDRERRRVGDYSTNGVYSDAAMRFDLNISGPVRGLDEI